jgi:L-alanine-DL-glutamate epimerase-like enolase superfamily enzyme
MPRGARNGAHPTIITRLEVEPLDIPLREPFVIATGRVESARNALVRVTLADGTVGLGEAAPFPPSGGETQETALAAVYGMAPLVEGQDAAAWRPLAARLSASFEHQATARAGIEVAVLDALTRSWGVPLYQFFGGQQASVTSDLSIPITTPEEVARLAQLHFASGARTLKLKVGTSVAEDIERMLALATGAPKAATILDGNQGYTPTAALELLAALERENIRPILFEQPTHRHDLEGLRYVTERAGIPVAADEAVHTAADALRVARLGAANVINIKLMKSGLVEALDIAAVCRAAHIDLMIGAMIESRLGSAASAHLAAGLGGFTYVDLDIPMLLAEDPFTGGYTQDGMEYQLDPATPGHGVKLKS